MNQQQQHWRDPKEKVFYIAWMTSKNVPCILTGPFENTDQAKQAIDALQPLHRNRRLVYVGGELWRRIGW